MIGTLSALAILRWLFTKRDEDDRDLPVLRYLANASYPRPPFVSV